MYMYIYNYIIVCHVYVYRNILNAQYETACRDGKAENVHVATCFIFCPLQRNDNEK